jgi:hypothetical protein
MLRTLRLVSESGRVSLPHAVLWLLALRFVATPGPWTLGGVLVAVAWVAGRPFLAGMGGLRELRDQMVRVRNKLGIN